MKWSLQFIEKTKISFKTPQFFNRICVLSSFEFQTPPSYGLALHYSTQHLLLSLNIFYAVFVLSPTISLTSVSPVSSQYAWGRVNLDYNFNHLFSINIILTIYLNVWPRFTFLILSSLTWYMSNMFLYLCFVQQKAIEHYVEGMMARKSEPSFQHQICLFLCSPMLTLRLLPSSLVWLGLCCV